MSLIYVFAASTMEAGPVRKASETRNGGSVLRCGVNDVVLLSGAMGPKNAKRRAEAAFALTSIPQPEAVLVIGLCGALNARLKEGSIVAYDECLSTEPQSGRIPCSESVTTSITEHLAQSNVACTRVVGITSPTIATNRAERAVLARYGADVVDMETHAILVAAGAVGVPAAVLRVVSDSSERILPNLNRALNETGGLDGRKALGIALRSPLATIRLLAANTQAMRRLSGPLQAILKAPVF